MATDHIDENTRRVNPPKIYGFRAAQDPTRKITFLAPTSHKANAAKAPLLWKNAKEQEECFFSIWLQERARLGPKNVVKLVKWNDKDQTYTYEMTDSNGEVLRKTAPRTKPLKVTRLPTALPPNPEHPAPRDYDVRTRNVNKWAKERLNSQDHVRLKQLNEALKLHPKKRMELDKREAQIPARKEAVGYHGNFYHWSRPTDEQRQEKAAIDVEIEAIKAERKQIEKEEAAHKKLYNELRGSAFSELRARRLDRALPRNEKASILKTVKEHEELNGEIEGTDEELRPQFDRLANQALAIRPENAKNPSPESLKIRGVVEKMVANAQKTVSNPHIKSTLIAKTNTLALKTFTSENFALQVRNCIEVLLHFLASPFVYLYTIIFNAKAYAERHETAAAIGPVDHEKRLYTNQKTMLSQIRFLARVFSSADPLNHYRYEVASDNNSGLAHTEFAQPRDSENAKRPLRISAPGRDTVTDVRIQSGAQKMSTLLIEAHQLGTALEEASASKNKKVIDKVVEQITKAVAKEKVPEEDKLDPVIIPIGLGEGKNYCPHFLIIQLVHMAGGGFQYILKHIHIPPPTVDKGRMQTVRTYNVTQMMQGHRFGFFIRSLIPLLSEDDHAHKKDGTKRGPLFHDLTLPNLILDFGDEIEGQAPVIQTTSRDPVKALYTLVKQIALPEHERITRASSQLQKITESKSSFLLHYINELIDFVKANETELDPKELLHVLKGLKYHTEKLKHTLEKDEGLEVALSITKPLMDFVDQKLKVHLHIASQDNQVVKNLNQKVVPFAAKMTTNFGQALQVEPPKIQGEDSRVHAKLLEKIKLLKVEMEKPQTTAKERKKIIDAINFLLEDIEKRLASREPKAAKTLSFALLRALPPAVSNNENTSVFWDSLQTKEECALWGKTLFQLSEKMFEACMRTGSFPLAPEEAFEFNMVLPLTQRRIFEMQLDSYPDALNVKLHEYKNDATIMRNLRNAQSTFIKKREGELEDEVRKKLKKKWEKEDENDVKSLERFYVELRRYDSCVEAWAPVQAWIDGGQVGAPPAPPSASYGNVPPDPNLRPQAPNIRSDAQKQIDRKAEFEHVFKDTKLNDPFLVELRRVGVDILDRFFDKIHTFSVNMQVIFGHYARTMGMSKDLFSYSFYALYNGIATTMMDMSHTARPENRLQVRRDIWTLRKDYSLMVGASPEMEHRFACCKLFFSRLPVGGPSFTQDTRATFLIGYDNIEEGWKPELSVIQNVQNEIDLLNLGFFTGKESGVDHLVPEEISWMRKTDEMQNLLNAPETYLMRYHSWALSEVVGAFTGTDGVTFDMAKSSFKSMDRVYLAPAFQGGRFLKGLLKDPIKATFVVSDKPDSPNGTFCFKYTIHRLGDPKQAPLYRMDQPTEKRTAYLGEASFETVEKAVASDNEATAIQDSVKFAMSNERSSLTAAQHLMLQETALKDTHNDPDHNFNSITTVGECFHYIYQAASLYPHVLEEPSVQDTIYDHLFQRGLVRKALQRNPQFFIHFGPILKNIVSFLREKEETQHGALFVTELAERIRLQAVSMAKLTPPLLPPAVAESVDLALPTYEFDVDVVTRFLEKVPTAKQKLYAYYTLLFYVKYLAHKLAHRDQTVQKEHAANFLKAYSIFQRSSLIVGHSGLRHQLHQDLQECLPLLTGFVAKLDSVARNQFLNELSGQKRAVWHASKTKAYVYECQTKQKIVTIDFRTGDGFSIPITAGQRGQLPITITENPAYKQVFKETKPLCNSQTSANGEVTSYTWIDKTVDVSYTILHYHPKRGGVETIQIYQECQGVHYRFTPLELAQKSGWEKLQGALEGWTYRQNNMVSKLIKEKGVWVKVDKKTRKAIDSSSAHIALHDTLKSEVIDLHLRGQSITGASIGSGDHRKWLCSRLSKIDKDLLPFQGLHNVLLLSSDKQHVDEIRFPNRSVKRSGDNRDRWVISGREEWQWKTERSEDAIKRFGENYHEYVQVFVETRKDPKTGKIVETGKKEYYVYAYVPMSLGKKGSPVKLVKTLTDCVDAAASLAPHAFNGQRPNLPPQMQGMMRELPPNTDFEVLRGIAGLADSYAGTDLFANPIDSLMLDQMPGVEPEALDRVTEALGPFKATFNPSPVKYTVGPNGESSSHAGFLYLGYTAYLRGDFAAASRFLNLMAEKGSSASLDDLNQLEFVAIKVLGAEIASQGFIEGHLIPKPPSFRKRMFHLKLLVNLARIKESLLTQHKLSGPGAPQLQLFQMIEMGGQLYGTLAGTAKEYRMATPDLRRLMKEHGLLLSEVEKRTLNRVFPIDFSALLDNPEITNILNTMGAPPALIDGLKAKARPEPKKVLIAKPTEAEFDKFLEVMSMHIDSNPSSSIDELHRQKGKALKWQTVMANFWSYWEWICYTPVTIEELSFLFADISLDEPHRAEVETARRLLLFAFAHKGIERTFSVYRDQHINIENYRRAMPNFARKQENLDAAKANQASKPGLWNQARYQTHLSTIAVDRAEASKPVLGKIGGKEEPKNPQYLFKVATKDFFRMLEKHFSQDDFVLTRTGTWMAPPPLVPRAVVPTATPIATEHDERWNVFRDRLVGPLKMMLKTTLTTALAQQGAQLPAQIDNFLDTFLYGMAGQFKQEYIDLLNSSNFEESYGVWVDTVLAVNLKKYIEGFLTIFRQPLLEDDTVLSLAHIQVILNASKKADFNPLAWMVLPNAGAAPNLVTLIGVAIVQIKMQLQIDYAAHLPQRIWRETVTNLRAAYMREMPQFMTGKVTPSNTKAFLKKLDDYTVQLNNRFRNQFIDGLTNAFRSPATMDRACDAFVESVSQHTFDPFEKRDDAISMGLVSEAFMRSFEAAKASLLPPSAPLPTAKKADSLIPVAPGVDPLTWETNFFVKVDASASWKAKWDKRIKVMEGFIDKPGISSMEKNKNKTILDGMRAASEKLKTKCHRALNVSEVRNMEVAIERRLTHVEKECARLEDEIHHLARDEAVALQIVFVYSDRCVPKEQIFEMLVTMYEKGELKGKLQAKMTHYLLARTESQQLVKAEEIRAEMWGQLVTLAQALPSHVDTPKLRRHELARITTKSVNWLLKSDDLLRHLKEGADRLRYARTVGEGFCLDQPQYTRRYLGTDMRKAQISRRPAMEAVEQAMENNLRFVKLLMGMGKSTEIIPKMVDLAIEKGKTPVVVTTPALIEQQKTFMVNAGTERAFVFEFNIDHGLVRINKEEIPEENIFQHLEHLLATLNGLKADKRYILTTPAAKASLRNKLVQLQLQLVKAVEEERGAPQRREALRYRQRTIFSKLHTIKEIWAYFHTDTDMDDILHILDEDIILDIAYEHNFAQGDPEKVNAILFDASYIFADALEADPFFRPLIMAGRLPEFSKQDKPSQQKELTPVMERLFRNVAFWTHAGWQEWDYLPYANVHMVGSVDEARLMMSDTSKKTSMIQAIQDPREMQKQLRKADSNGCTDIIIVVQHPDQVAHLKGYFTALHQKKDEFVRYVLEMDKTIPQWIRLPRGVFLDAKDHKHICHVVALKTTVSTSFPSVATTSFEFNVERGFSSHNGCSVVPFDAEGEKPNTHYGNRGERNLHYLLQHLFYPIPEALFIKKYKELCASSALISPFGTETWLDWSKRLNAKSGGKEPYEAFMHPSCSRQRMQLSRHLALIDDGKSNRPALEDHPQEIVCNSQDVTLVNKEENVLVLSGTGDVVSLGLYDLDKVGTEESNKILSGVDETSGETALCLFALDDEEARGGLNLEIDPSNIFENPLKNMELEAENLDCTALINGGFSVFGNNEFKLATHLRMHLQRKGIERQLIFRNAKGDTLIWQPGNEFAPIPYDRALVEDTSLCIFGINSIRGVDVKRTKGKKIYAKILLHIGMDLDTFNQAVWRLRQLGYGQQIRFAMDTKMEKYIRRVNNLGPKDKIQYGHAYNAIKLNTLEEESLRHVKAVVFKVQKDFKKAIARVQFTPYQFLTPTDKTQDVLIKFEALIAAAHSNLYVFSNEIDWHLFYAPQVMLDRTEFLKDLYKNEIKKILAMKAKFLEGMREIQIVVGNDLDPVSKHALGKLHKQIAGKHAQIMMAYENGIHACERGLVNLDKPTVQEFLASHLPDHIPKEVHKENNQQEAQQQVEAQMQKQVNTLALTAMSYTPYNTQEAALDYHIFKTHATDYAGGHFRPVLATQQIGGTQRDEFRDLFENLFISNRAQSRFAMTSAKNQPFVHILVIRNRPDQGNAGGRTFTRSCIVTPTEWQQTIHTALETERMGERTLVGAYAIPANRFAPMCLDCGNWDDRNQLENNGDFENIILMNKFFLGWQHFLYTDPQKEVLKSMMTDFENAGTLDEFLAFLKIVSPKSGDLINGIKKERDDAREKEKAARQAELDKMNARGVVVGSAGMASASESLTGSTQHNVNYQTQNPNAPAQQPVPVSGSAPRTSHDVVGMPPPGRTRNPSRLLNTVRGPITAMAAANPASAALHSAAANPPPHAMAAPRPPSPDEDDDLPVGASQPAGAALEPETPPADGDDRFPVMEPVDDE